jgi:uncharacterized membrane protein YdjX (TVP38/TMEM64 family)
MSEANETRPRPAWRLGALALVVLALALAGHASGASDLRVESLRASVEGAGAAGVLVFVLAFAAGELLHVPGLVFVLVAVLVWGRLAGGAIAYAGSLVSLATSFGFVRAISGDALATIERPWVKRALERLDARPVLTVALLRLVFIVSPPLNYTLALTRIRFRDYLVGSALGLVVPVGLAVVFFDAIAKVFST